MSDVKPPDLRALLRKHRLPVALVLFGLSAYFLLSTTIYGAIAGPPLADADDLARLRGGDGTTATATLESIDKRWRSRSSKAGGYHIYCPVYTYSRTNSGSTPRPLGWDRCRRDRDDLPEIGTTVSVIYDPALYYVAFIDNAETDEILARDERDNWIAIVVATLMTAASGIYLGWVLLTRKRAVRPGDPTS